MVSCFDSFIPPVNIALWGAQRDGRAGVVAREGEEEEEEGREMAEGQKQHSQTLSKAMGLLMYVRVMLEVRIYSSVT